MQRITHTHWGRRLRLLGTRGRARCHGRDRAVQRVGRDAGQVVRLPGSGRPLRLRHGLGQVRQHDPGVRLLELPGEALHNRRRLHRHRLQARSARHRQRHRRTVRRRGRPDRQPRGRAAVGGRPGQLAHRRVLAHRHVHTQHRQERPRHRRPRVPGRVRQRGDDDSHPHLRRPGLEPAVRLGSALPAGLHLQPHHRRLRRLIPLAGRLHADPARYRRRCQRHLRGRAQHALDLRVQPLRHARQEAGHQQRHERSARPRHGRRVDLRGVRHQEHGLSVLGVERRPDPLLGPHRRRVVRAGLRLDPFPGR